MARWNRLLALLVFICSSAACPSSRHKSTRNTNLSCNGQTELCDLRYDQITYAGSHSAGSGFDGSTLRQCDGMVEMSCVFPTQSLSIAGQLELGIRYLTLDICFLPQECDASSHNNLGSSRLVACRGSETDTTNFNGFSYGGSLSDILEQVDGWMRNNPHEVVGLHFTRNVPSADRSQIFDSLVPILESKWGPGTSSRTGNSSATEMNTFYKSNSNTWPTLRQAITDNQRIFVFADQELIDGEVSVLWKNPSPFINFEPNMRDRGCNMPGIEGHALLCNNTGNEDLIIMAGHTLAICISTGQTSCNTRLQSASDICYGFRQEVNRTVNVVLVDFPELGVGMPGSVFNVTRELNTRNIQRFHVEEIVEPYTTAMSDDPSMVTSSGSGDGDMSTADDSTTDTTSSARNSVPCSNNHCVVCSVTLALFVIVCSALHISC